MGKGSLEFVERPKRSTEEVDREGNSACAAGGASRKDCTRDTQPACNQEAKNGPLGVVSQKERAYNQWRSKSRVNAGALFQKIFYEMHDFA